MSEPLTIDSLQRQKTCKLCWSLNFSGVKEDMRIGNYDEKSKTHQAYINNVLTTVIAR